MQRRTLMSREQQWFFLVCQLAATIPQHLEQQSLSTHDKDTPTPRSRTWHFLPDARSSSTVQCFAVLPSIEFHGNPKGNAGFIELPFIVLPLPLLLLETIPRLPASITKLFFGYLSTMRSENQPHGKFFTVSLPMEKCQEHTPALGRLPKGARGHMLVVLGWTCRRNWVKVATVSIFVMLNLRCIWVNE